MAFWEEQTTQDLMQISTITILYGIFRRCQGKKRKPEVCCHLSKNHGTRKTRKEKIFKSRMSADTRSTAKPQPKWKKTLEHESFDKLRTSHTNKS
jgi:hypothetical protein